MAAVFLVTLYEYSPLFYIAVVFTCFIVTTGLVLGWFGWDVPVILRNSEETQFSTRVFKKQMRQVKNPFGLEISNPSTASITTGITLTTDCLEDSHLTCYWGCSVQKLYEALQKHVYCFRISTPQALDDALYSEYLYQEQYFIKKDSKEEIYCQLPGDTEIEDFGTVPRSRYPLVALLTLADQDDREIYDIISMVSVIHIPDKAYKLSCRILYQYLLLAQGQFHDLKSLSRRNNRRPELAGKGGAVRQRSGALGGDQQGLRGLPERERELGAPALPARVPVRQLRALLPAVPHVQAAGTGVLCTL
uniref:cell growth regulator with RING finger domain protein 1 isoform X2 n=1 Tax=Jaculus jaculus TaxID=51337 RepID=UPI001E1B5BAB|nr:cell growth regulator with RING finger domain protein 1 isoform X2 [Jaculus jaculus]